jgi:hypothetical protein
LDLCTSASTLTRTLQRMSVWQWAVLQGLGRNSGLGVFGRWGALLNKPRSQARQGFAALASVRYCTPGSCLSYPPPSGESVCMKEYRFCAPAPPNLMDVIKAQTRILRKHKARNIVKYLGTGVCVLPHVPPAPNRVRMLPVDLYDRQQGRGGGEEWGREGSLFSFLFLFFFWLACLDPAFPWQRPVSRSSPLRSFGSRHPVCNLCMYIAQSAPRKVAVCSWSTSPEALSAGNGTGAPTSVAFSCVRVGCSIPQP